LYQQAGGQVFTLRRLYAIQHTMKSTLGWMGRDIDDGQNHLAKRRQEKNDLVLKNVASARMYGSNQELTLKNRHDSKLLAYLQ